MQQATSRGLQLGLPVPSPSTTAYASPHKSRQLLAGPVTPLPPPPAATSTPPAASLLTLLPALQSPMQLPAGQGPLPQQPAGDHGAGSSSDAEQSSGVLLEAQQRGAADTASKGDMEQDYLGSDVDEDSGSYSCSSGDFGSDYSDSDVLDDLEDLLVQELFFPGEGRAGLARLGVGGSKQQQHSQQGVGESEPVEGNSAAAAPTAQSGSPCVADGTAGETSSAAALAGAAEDAKACWLFVQLSRLEQVSVPEGCVSSSLHGALRVSGMAASTRVSLAQLLDGGAAAAAADNGAGSPTCVEVGVKGPLQLREQQQQLLLTMDPKPILMVELWVTTGEPGQQQCSSSSSPQKQLAQPSEQQLLGLVKVPLSLDDPSAAAAASNPLLLQSTELLASGDYPVWDVMIGRSNGMLHVDVSLDDSRHLQQGDERAERVLGVGGLGYGTGPHQEAVPVLAVRHTFDVAIQSAANLPSGDELQAAGQLVPSSRFICYKFPGEGC